MLDFCAGLDFLRGVLTFKLIINARGDAVERVSRDIARRWKDKICKEFLKNVMRVEISFKR